MGFKLIVLLIIVALWVLWPAIRIPKDNFVRQKLGTFGTYLLVIVGLLALLQVMETLLGLKR